MTAARVAHRPGRRRLITVSSSLVTALALLPGCSLSSPNVVAENYAPADGLSADLPDLKVRNLLVVASEDGVGVVSASMFNETSEPLSVRLTIADGVLDATVEVPAAGRLTLTGAGGSALNRPGGTPGAGATGTGAAVAAPSAGAEPGAEGGPAAEGGSSAATQVVTVEALATPPGGAVTIGITSPGGGTVTRTAPVLLDQGPYEGFVPTPDTSGATARASTTP